MTKGLPVRDLLRLAKSFGIQRFYRGLGEERHHASPEALLVTLRSLTDSVQSFDDVTEALRLRQAELGKRLLEPVLVCWDRRSLPFTLRLSRRRLPRRIDARLTGENGEDHHLSWNLADLATREESVGNEPYLAVELIIDELDLGVHRLEVQAGVSSGESTILSAPSQCYRQKPDSRRWGLFAPTYGLRSGDDWGMGDLSELRRFAELTSRHGGALVGTLPLLPTFLERPFEPSPYSPISRLFWNELLIDPRRTREWEQSIEARRSLEQGSFVERVEKLRSDPLVDYRAQLALRRPLLEDLARCAHELRPGALARFAAQSPRALDYAQFRAMAEERATSWPDWPALIRQGTIAPDAVSPERVRYHLYCQMAGEEQLSQLVSESSARGVGLYLDLPLGVHRHGYDTWREQALFAHRQSVGAPPDPVFPDGQNWTFPPIVPERARAQGHRYFRAALRHHLRHAGALRIDHVMGLHRQFWIPEGLPVKDGLYIRYPAEELYAALSLESHRAQCELVGENLGLVPAEVNRALRRHAVRGIYLLPYSLTGYPARPAQKISTQVVASLNTHDTPTFAGFIQRVEDEGTPDATKTAIRAFSRQPTATVEELFHWLAHLLESRAGIVIVNLEDLWLETEPQNIPGSGLSHPNWRRKCRIALDATEEIEPLLQAFSAIAGNRIRAPRLL